MSKKILSALLAALMLAGCATAFGGCGCKSNNKKKKTESSQANTAVRADPASVKQYIAEGSILQTFSWDFNTIKESMPDIAAAGYSAIQTSPINACLEGEGGGMELYGDGKWYYHYQPTDFKIGNYQLGTREEFKAMCAEAHKYDIKVLVDVIANHTTPQLNMVAQELIDAGGGSFETLVHKNNSSDIMNYDDRLECTTAKMGGLPDINTERPSFQTYFFNYINDCIDCGADGFRYDTAKHIGLPDDPKDDGFENNFWEKVRTETKDYDQKFIYGEVLQGGNDCLAEYISEIGRTTASTYGGRLRSALESDSLSTGSIKSYWLGKDVPLNMVTWVESHDNYINDRSWKNLDNTKVALGWAVITARKDGTPLFFARPYHDDPENNEWGMNRIGPQGDDLYKDSRVSAVNYFRTAMVGEDENLFNPNSDSSALVVERGSKGAVIVNTAGALDTGFETALADGSYTDRVDGSTVYTVKDGKLTCDKPIPENTVVVLYNEGYTERTPMADTDVAADTAFRTDGDSINVKLTLKNAAEGTYSIDGGEAKTYKDGDSITLNKPADGSVVKVELRAKNEKDVPTYERLEFTFEESYQAAKGDKVYFEKPEGWGDTVNAYVYNIADEDENRIWPGEEMKKEDDGKYSYTFARDFDKPLIIFNDGEDSNQYPLDKGFKVEADKTYTAE